MTLSSFETGFPHRLTFISVDPGGELQIIRARAMTVAICIQTATVITRRPTAAAPIICTTVTAIPPPLHLTPAPAVSTSEELMPTEHVTMTRSRTAGTGTTDNAITDARP